MTILVEYGAIAQSGQQEIEKQGQAQNKKRLPDDAPHGMFKGRGFHLSLLESSSLSDSASSRS